MSTRIITASVFAVSRSSRTSRTCDREVEVQPLQET
jgi:hypothetical protein